MKNGYLYDGDFQRNMFHGMGKLRSPNGQYIGQFQNGKKWGHGMFKWNDGSFYEGDYSNDLKHGRGRFVSADRQVIEEGEWRGGNFIGGDMVGIGMSGGAPIPPMNAAANLAAGLSGIMGAGNAGMPPMSTMSNVQPFAPPNGSLLLPRPPNGYVETTTTTVESGPTGYINPTSYVAPTSANFMPPAALSTYTPAGGLAPISAYNPGTLTPASNYIPPNLSQYNPGVMSGNSNMSFRT
jgi:hypothetical protein